MRKNGSFKDGKMKYQCSECFTPCRLDFGHGSKEDPITKAPNLCPVDGSCTNWEEKPEREKKEIKKPGG